MGNSYFQTRRWFRSLKLQTHIYTAKKIERHIVNECLAYLNKFDLICAEQFGKKSCHTALSKLASSLLRVIDNGNITGLVYEDFKKAFDLVAHDILVIGLYSIQKLKRFGLRSPWCENSRETQNLSHRIHKATYEQKKKKFCNLCAVSIARVKTKSYQAVLGI